MVVFDQAIDLKGEMSLMNVLLLHSGQLRRIEAALAEKQQKAGQFLNKSPIIVDCSPLGEDSGGLDFSALRQLLLTNGLVPVGIRNLPEEAEAAAAEAGWALLRPSRAASQPVPHAPAESSRQKKPADVQRLLVVERPVRSGQQVYCPDGDIVVMQQTSAGSELLAGGSVHVYGTLRGRVLAGIQGDISARIFCQKLEAELIAVAGRYRLLDEIDGDLKGQAVMIYLEGEKLKIVPI